ncbi:MULTISPECIES: hypothetical protein [Clostridium]|uniref:hypothetical protein n=1 Tax=Clostridium TaxID=1485 RepID=UPI0008256877|nr:MULTISPECIES: hypothetical protein [Clostridium]PJI07813.1 hypothetical protein CUB90_08030 [Clostridium sp. CT7]
MTYTEYLSKIKDSNINLERLNIVIGRKTNVPYSKGCYQENDIWYFYDVNERQDLVITKTGTEDEIFGYLYLITRALLKQYRS